MRKIILASVSPRRRQLLKLFGIKFKAVDSGYKEVLHKHLLHSELVKFLALGKAKAAAKKYPAAIIIAADTVVSFGGQAIGKPKNKGEAFLMLKSFSGKSHNVFTGLVILDAASGRIFSVHDKTKIYFHQLSDLVINNYIVTNQPFDKAGGYGPIGPGLNLIKKIQGDATTALGLPMKLVFEGLQKLGIKI